MLNIKSKISENLTPFTLFDSGKSCYVMARYCLEATFWTFYVPGFLLMQQALENLIKACLKKENINWRQKNGNYGSKGHNFKRLIDLGEDIKFLKHFGDRQDFMSLLKELEDGYNSQRYGESGHFLQQHEKMMDLFDEMVFILISGFQSLSEVEDESRLERMIALPVPLQMEEAFNHKLKQPFTLSDIIPLDIK